MKRLTILLLALLAGPIASHADEWKVDTDEIQTGRQVSWMAGYCSALKRLVAYQTAADMTGGRDLVVAFISLEAKATGMTDEELIIDCDDWIEKNRKVDEWINEVIDQSRSQGANK